MSTTIEFIPEPHAAPPWNDAQPGTSCPPSFGRRSGQVGTGGYPPVPGLGNQAVARVLADIAQLLEACWVLAEGDYGRSGIDFLLVDVEDVGQALLREQVTFVLANAFVGPEQELAPLVRRGDVVRFLRTGSFLPGRLASRYRFVRVTRDWQRRAQCGRGPEWLAFYGAPVRCYDWGVQLGPEARFEVKVAGLHRMPRKPVQFTTADGRLLVDVISLERSGPWYRIRQRAPGGLILLAEVRTAVEVDEVLWRRARASLADLNEVA